MLESVGMDSCRCREFDDCFRFAVGSGVWTAAGFTETCAVDLHDALLPQTRECVVENLRCARVRRCDEAIVHPLAVATCGGDTGVAEVSQMAGDFRLGRRKDFHEVADADLAVCDEIEEAKTGWVR